MGLFRRRSGVSVVFQRAATDPSVSCVELRNGAIRIAHAYSPIDDDCSLELHFYSQNYTVHTLVFTRRVEVSGGDFVPNAGVDVYRVFAPPVSLTSGCAEVVEPPCGSMTRAMVTPPRPTASVVTEVVLTLESSLKLDIPSVIEMRSILS